MRLSTRGEFGGAKIQTRWDVAIPPYTLSSILIRFPITLSHIPAGRGNGRPDNRGGGDVRSNG
jgi:hypothetical protein